MQLSVVLYSTYILLVDIYISYKIPLIIYLSIYIYIYTKYYIIVVYTCTSQQYNYHGFIQPYPTILGKHSHAMHMQEHAEPPI